MQSIIVLKLRCLLLVKCSAPQRHLLSFPTRRSSDLLVRGRTPPSVIMIRATRSANADVADLSGAGDSERGRSEEHTSELQSRGHLVCRLLLEKKKST